jgi:hypothetical protein
MAEQIYKAGYKIKAGEHCGIPGCPIPYERSLVKLYKAPSDLHAIDRVFILGRASTDTLLPDDEGLVSYTVNGIETVPEGRGIDLRAVLEEGIDKIKNPDDEGFHMFCDMRLEEMLAILTLSDDSITVIDSFVTRASRGYFKRDYVFSCDVHADTIQDFIIDTTAIKSR